MNSVVSPKESLDSKPSTSSLVLNDVKLGKPKQENVEEVAKAKKEGPDNSNPPSSGSDTHPEEFHGGQWDVDHIQYCNFNPVTSRLNDSLSINTLDPKRMKNGAAYRALSDKDTSDYKCFRDEHNELYRVGDFVYMDLETAYPYVVGKVESFKMKKGTQMTVKVTRLYRREDLLPDSLSLLEVERHEAGIEENNSDVLIRELFPSDTHLTQSVAVLRGKCQIVHLGIKQALQDNQLERNVFFYCTSYSADTGRLSACHPEIREGDKYQATCPKLDDSVIGDEPDRDQLVYKPGNMCTEAEDTVVKYARSYRSLVLLDNPHINELERTAFQGDRVKIDALDCLTRCGYVAADAVKQMVEDDKVFLEHTQFLSADDTKKFVKGLRNYGKNFPKIVKEYLPTFSRDALVHYYYWWKKSGDAFKPKKANGTVVKKVLFPQPKKPQKASTSEPQLVDYDSVSEDEEPEWRRACHHCYVQESRDWHHSGPLNQLLCTSCRHHFKHYGTMRDVQRPKEIPNVLLHDESLNGSEEGEEGVKTRASNRRGDRLKTPIDDDRTPIKNGIDVEGERRSTPQRTVKSHKRTYHPSTSSTEEVITPKKTKDTKLHKLKPIHQLALTNKLNKTEKQESLDSDDQQQAADDDKASPKKQIKTDSLEIIEDTADTGSDPPVEIRDDHPFTCQLLAECSLKRRRPASADPEEACSRTQFVFVCTDEPKWTARRRAKAEEKQKERREKQQKEQMEAAHQKALEHEQEQIRQMQLQASASVAGMPRMPADMLHAQMRLPGLPPNSMMRPQMSSLTPELMALASTRPELLALLMQQPPQPAQPPNQVAQRPPMLPPSFGGGLGPGGLPPALNPLLAAQNPANALIFQMQTAMQQQQQQQARFLEEQKRQQMEQREREQRQQLQQQLQNQQLHNQQLHTLMAMNAFNPQMLAAAGLPFLGLPTSVAPTSQAQLQQQILTSQQQQQNQVFDPAQLLRSTQAGPTIQQQQNQQELLHLYNQLVKQQQQEQQRK